MERPLRHNETVASREKLEYAYQRGVNAGSQNPTNTLIADLGDFATK